MTEAELRAILLETWADPPEVAGQRIFRADGTLPMLCCTLELADPERCAAIVFEVVRRRGKRQRKTYAVCLRPDGYVIVCREFDADSKTLVGYVDKDSPPEILEAQLRGKRAADRATPLPEFQGWTE